MVSFICDAQIHAPAVEPIGQVNGMDEEPLLAAMDSAGVDRAILVPLATKTQPADNDPALEIARRHPTRLRVMGLVDVSRGAIVSEQIPRWLSTSGMLGVRVSCYREPLLSMLLNHELEWLWSTLQEHGVPVMLNAPDHVDEVVGVLERYPRLRIVLDHLGLRPHTVYEDLTDTVRSLSPLSRFDNCAVKATCLPSAVPGPYPFRAAHAGIRLAIDIFGADRVFWGSDLSRLPCSYREAIAMFTESLSLTATEIDLVMGQAICNWLAWPMGVAAQ
jgi:L-fuconolactonase